jgi:hypothetical protein
LVVGPLDLSAFAAPASHYVGIFVIFFGLAAIPLGKTRFFGFFSGGAFSLSLMLFILLLSLVMGFVPQRIPGSGGEGFLRGLGLFNLTTSWPFVFLYLAMLLSLSATVMRTVPKFKKRKIFLANHLGLFLVLLAAGIGAPDREQHVMRVLEGEVEWRVEGPKPGEVLQLPVAVRLDDFSMDEWPAHLAVIKKNTGTALPEGRPALFFLDDPGGQRGILDLEIEVLEFLGKAVPVGDGVFARAVMKASTQAAKLRVKSSLTGIDSEGWVAGGNRFVMPQPLTLDDERLLVMSRPEPKRFASLVKVFTEEGIEKEGEILVNKPLRAGDWMVYQHGYDNQAGNLSAWSSFLLVRDPWLFVAYAGFVLMALGAFGLVVMGADKGANTGAANKAANDVSGKAVDIAKDKGAD